MTEEPSPQDDLLDETRKKVHQYLSDRLLLFKMDAAEKSAKIISLLLGMIVVGALLFFVMLFVSLMLGYLFAEWTGNLFYGFAMLAGLYILLLLILLVAFKQWIRPRIINKVVSIFFDGKS